MKSKKRERERGKEGRGSSGTTGRKVPGTEVLATLAAGLATAVEKMKS